MVNNISILLLFNFIIIFSSYKYNNKMILLYPFIFIFLIILYLQLIYKKNTNIIEGYSFHEENEQIYTLWDKLNSDKEVKKEEEEEEEKDEYPILDKINKLLNLLLKVEEDGIKYYKDNECEGEFVEDKNERRCGFNIYDTETYKITKSGWNCEHMPGYKNNILLPLCKLDEECLKDKDCGIGKCYRGKCKMDFECDWGKLENCDENQCDKLNKDIGFNKNSYIDGTCKPNTCNSDQHYNCKEEECNRLGYTFIWDKNTGYCGKNTLDSDPKIYSEKPYLPQEKKSPHSTPHKTPHKTPHTPPGPQSNHTIQFINSSETSIYILFTHGSKNDFPLLKKDWVFYNNNKKEEGNLINSGDTLWFGPILSNTTLSVDYTGQGMPVWDSGKCSISPIEPKDGFNDGELSSMEWTFNPAGSFEPDLSALDGINIKADMKVIDGNSCDSKLKSCKIDFKDKNAIKHIKTNNQNVKSISRPPWKKSYSTFKGTNDDGTPSTCGTDENCIECPFNKGDYCKKGESLTDTCYAEDINTRWGCYKWWANPENNTAQDWLKIYETGEGCTSSYRWVFDETGIFKLNPQEKSLNTLKKTFWDINNKKWGKSDKYKCMFTRSDNLTGEMKGKCDGYPVKKGVKESPNISCGHAIPNTKLIYTIYDILT